MNTTKFPIEKQKKIEAVNEQINRPYSRQTLLQCYQRW